MDVPDKESLARLVVKSSVVSGSSTYILFFKMSYTLKLVYIYIAIGVAIDYITEVAICYILVGLVMHLIAFALFLVLQLLMVMMMILLLNCSIVFASSLVLLLFDAIIY